MYAGTGAPTDYHALPARDRIAVVRRSSEVTAAQQTAAAAAAGVRLLLVVNDGVGRLEDWYGAADQKAADRSPSPR